MSRNTGKGRQPGAPATQTVEMTYQELAEALGLASADEARQLAASKKWPTKGAKQGALAKVTVPKSALGKPKAAKPAPAKAVETKAEPAPAPVVETKPEPAPTPVVEAKAEPAPAPVVEAKPAPAPKAEPAPAPVVKPAAVAAVAAKAAAAVAPKAADVLSRLPKVVAGTPGGSLATQPPILGVNREGWVFVAVGLLGGWVLGHLWSLLGWLGVLFALWAVWFFRDPKRVVPTRDGLVVSPADGVVQSIGMEVPPAELDMGTKPRLRVSGFMNVFNVHVTRIPVDAKVVRTAYRPGKFFDASLDKASIHNERMSVSRVRPDGRELAFVQIAGLVARRIKCGLKDGQTVRAGQRFGLIRFGSRVDVYLPEGAQALVSVGQTAVAGETVLSDLSGSEPARQGVKR